jgi:hypothetical protein
MPAVSQASLTKTAGGQDLYVPNTGNGVVGVQTINAQGGVVVLASADSSILITEPAAGQINATVNGANLLPNSVNSAGGIAAQYLQTKGGKVHYGSAVAEVSGTTVLGSATLTPTNNNNTSLVAIMGGLINYGATVEFSIFSDTNPNAATTRGYFVFSISSFTPAGGALTWSEYGAVTQVNPAGASITPRADNQTAGIGFQISCPNYSVIFPMTVSWRIVRSFAP